MNHLLTIVSLIFEDIAVLSIGAASWMYLYQPETPECLRPLI